MFLKYIVVVIVSVLSKLQSMGGVVCLDKGFPGIGWVSREG